MGVATSSNPFYTFSPLKISLEQARDFKFGVHVDHSKSQPRDDKLSLKGAWSLSRDLFIFWKISNNISKTVRDSLIVSVKFEEEVVCALLNGYVADDLG